MKAILHVIESLGRGGAEMNLLGALKYFDKKKTRNRVISLYDTAGGMSGEFNRCGIETRCIGMRGLRDLYKGIGAITRDIKDKGCDLVHTQLFGANICGRAAAAMTGKKTVTTLQNPDYTFDRGTVFSCIRRKAVDSLTIAFARPYFTAVSGCVKDSFVKELGLNPGRIEVIHNSIDALSLKAASGAAAPAIDGIGRYILNVGRLHPQKGQKYLLAAFKEISARFPDLSLVVIGDGPLKQELAEMCRGLGIEKKVRFTGKVDNTAPYMARAAAFVFPSLYEGLPVALLEAMALGTPCVASRIPPTEEVDGGRRAIEFSGLKDAASIASAITKVLEDGGSRSSMTQAASRIVSEEFSSEKNAARLEAYLIRIAEGAG